MQGNSSPASAKHLTYLDFELEIGPGSGREYPVAVVRSPAGEAREMMRFPFDELALENRLDKLQIALLRSGGTRRRVPSPEEQAVQDFGQGLFNALFTGEVRSRYDVSQREAAEQDRGLRLKLRVQPPELAALPWEFLYDSRQAEYVCLSRNTPVVRYLELPQPILPLTVRPPLRILGMIARPHDLAQLDVAREKQRVENAIQVLRANGLVELTWLEGQTWRDLQRAMRTGPWHVFHFIGHGGYDRQTEEGCIALADEEGKSFRLSATQLGRLLADHRSLRVVLLNACEGARGSERDIFSSAAAILVRRGIPAVLAMQYEITDRAAVEFARTFYEALTDEMPVDEAVTEARKAISMMVANTVEWGTPVLYMRSPDGMLFNLEAARQARQAAERLERELAERKAQEKAAQEKAARKAQEAERLEQERRAREAKEQAACREAERLERERLAREQASREEAERQAKVAAAKAEAERLERERQEREAKEKAAKEEAERQAKLAAEKAEAGRLERNPVGSTIAAARVLAAEKAEVERLEQERREREAREKAAKEEAERQAKLAAGKAEADMAPELTLMEQAFQQARAARPRRMSVQEYLAQEKAAKEETDRQAKLAAEKAEVMPSVMRRVDVGWAFLLQWVLANAVGAGIGWAVGLWVIGFSAGHLYFMSQGYADLMYWTILGASIGTMQWLILRQRIHRIGWWVLASAVGWSSIAYLRWFTEYLHMHVTVWSLTWGFIVGTLSGIIQWLLLRRRVYQAGWWVLTNAVGWAVGLAVGNAVSMVVVLNRTGIAEMWVGAGLLSGAITGCVLVWLLRHLIPEV